MVKVMATGYLFLFCVVSLVIKESSAIIFHCPPKTSLPVSTIIHFRALSCFYTIIYALYVLVLFFEIFKMAQP